MQDRADENNERRTAGKEFINEFLAANTTLLRKILDDLEQKLVAAGLLPLKDAITVARIESISATYVLTRVATVSHKQLSPRQLEVAVLLGSGAPRKVIARQLRISIRTVDSHRDRIYAKLGVESPMGLARWILLLN